MTDFDALATGLTHQVDEYLKKERISQCAAALDNARNAWLNEPGVEEAELKKRTLTNLYNTRPAWLDKLHVELDKAVHAAYGWPYPLTEDEILERLLRLNRERAEASNAQKA